MVDCDVAPLSACHLLLGQPWQFDLDATHHSRSNTYSFIRKCMSHMLKPMMKTAIKVDIFPAVRKKKKDQLLDTPKPRTALFQGDKNDMAILDDDLMANCNNNVTENVSNLINIFAKPRTTLIQGEGDDETMTPHIDRSKYPQLYAHMQAGNYLKTSSIRFGCVQFKENMMKGVNQIFTNAGLSSKLSFGSIHLLKKRCKNNKFGLVL
jgi:hypothetical protein